MASRGRHSIFNKGKCGAMQVRLLHTFAVDCPVSQRLQDSFMPAYHFFSKKNTRMQRHEGVCIVQVHSFLNPHYQEVFYGKKREQ